MDVDAGIGKGEEMHGGERREAPSHVGRKRRERIALVRAELL